MSRAAETSIEIAAHIDTVWRVLTDLGAYSTWNPFIVEVVRAPTPAVGVDITLRVRWAEGGETISVERILRVEPPHDVDGERRAVFEYRFHSWMHAVGMIRATRVQTLTQKDGVTHYFTREAFTGWGASGVPLAKVQTGFEAQARALKEACER